MKPVTTVGVDSIVLALDTPLTTLAEAEHALLGLGQQVPLPPDALLSTHMVRDSQPHYAFSLTAPDQACLAAVQQYFAAWDSAVSHDQPSASSGYSEGLRLATTEAFARSGGRSVRFPGWAGIVGSPTVAEVLASSAIDRLEVLGGTPANPTDVLHSRDFVRPLWRRGELVLPVLPAGAGAIAPFEVPNPTPCCGEHSPVSS
jgi:hypothetical protein